jgi:hypothetical protein
LEVISETCCSATIVRIVREIGMSLASAPSMNFVSFGIRIARFVEEDDQPALDRQVLEDHVHHGLQQIAKLLGLQKRLRDLHQDLEDLPRVTCARLSRLRRRAYLLRELSEVEAELGLKSEMRRMTVPDGLSNIDSPVKSTLGIAFTSS